MENEIWKDIEGYEGLYQVSNLGRVKSLERKVLTKNGSYRSHKERIVAISRTGNIHKDGSYYLKVVLTKNSIRKNFILHRLVAKYFCNNPNPEKYTEVNHIDENKHNNKASNLEWCDRKINNHHSLITEKLNEAKKKAVLQYSLSGEFIAEFSGIREAAREVGLKTHKHIGECCHGREKTAGGYIWKFKES